MKVSPDYSGFKAAAIEYPGVSMYAEIPGDIETPVSAFLKVRKGDYSFLLESAEQGEKAGRFSFLGTSPELIIKSRGRDIDVYNSGTGKTETISTADPLKVLEDIRRIYAAPAIPGLPCFTGGLIGYISYDFVRQIEAMPSLLRDTGEFPDTCFFLARDVIVFDHFRRKLILVTTVPVKDFSSPERAYASGCEALTAMKRSLDNALPGISFTGGGGTASFSSNFPHDKFLQSVEATKEHIFSGDVVQAVISQRWSKPLDTNPVNLYRALRSINPSPYMFFFQAGDTSLIGSSPEILVKLEGEKATVRPIAGTRKRGADLAEENLMEKDLLSDEKEKAEHVMLVDLGRNDLGRVCSPGSVKVTELMAVEKYSHVMHLVSNVEGRIKKGYTPLDLLKAAFPAGTVSGAPKIRAMEIIEGMEPCRRGPYAGALGYISLQNNMDFCITIRTMVVKGGMLHIQAGAGIVADSQPENEYAETRNKAKGLMDACEYSKELDIM